MSATRTQDALTQPGVRLPDTYVHAKQALTECSKIDECQDWADKAAALASYAGLGKVRQGRARLGRAREGSKFEKEGGTSNGLDIEIPPGRRYLPFDGGR